MHASLQIHTFVLFCHIPYLIFSAGGGRQRQGNAWHSPLADVETNCRQPAVQKEASALSSLVLRNELCADGDGELRTPGSEWRNIPDPCLPVIQKEEGYLHGLFSILNVSLFIIRDLFREGGLVAHLLDGPSFITCYFVVLVGWHSCTQSLHGHFTLCHTHSEHHRMQFR